MVKSNTHHDKTRNEKTPFGVWSPDHPSADAQGMQAGPSAVVTSEDGSQRPAKSDDFTVPKFAGQSQTPVQNSDIKSFSATFGVSPASIPVTLPPVEELFDEEENQPTGSDATVAPLPAEEAAPKKTMLQLDPEMLGTKAAPKEEEDEDFLPPEPTPIPEVLRKEPEKIDPFAWSPEEIPTSSEPRHQRNGLANEAAWMAPTTEYPTTPFIEPATPQLEQIQQPEKLEPVATTINPYTFGKEDQWKAPPMTVEEAAKAEAEAEIAAQMAMQPPQEEATVASPFDFAVYDASQNETITQPPITDPLLPLGTSEQPDMVPDLTDGQPSPHEAPQAETRKESEQPIGQSAFQLEDSLPEDTMPAQPEEQPAPADMLSRSDYAPTMEEQPLTEEMPNISYETEEPLVAAQSAETAFTAQDSSAFDSDANTSPFATEEQQNAWSLPTEEQSGFLGPYAPAEQTNGTNGTNGQRQFGDSTIHHILQEHMDWLHSGGRNGRRANFRNANLQGFNLGNAQLAEASLRGADLSGANLNGADLRGADLSEAILDGANLGNANLAAAILTRADLHTAYLAGADLHSADLSSANLMGANLSGLSFASAILQDTNLQGTDLTHANLQNANLRGANARSANLSSALLASANCRDVCFDQAILDNAQLDGTNMKNASMQGASLIGVDIAAAEEISAEHRQESIYAEKNHIQQEWERIRSQEAMVKQLQTQIQQREMTLQTERANVERAKREMRGQFESIETLINKTYEVMIRHRVHDKRMKYLGIMWFLLTTLILVGIMLFVKALEINELDWVSLSIVLASCTVIMTLVIATTVRSIRLSNNLKQLLEIYDKHFPQQDNTGQ